ncbi:MAG: sigma-70 family RNA polymerase sigma factor [Deltaproteobacteria bacterium]|nr:sigma-70 family RNA polymerase sigma factor [Deltaproteobacteria bacterium]
MGGTAPPRSLEAEDVEFVRTVARSVHRLLPPRIELDELVSYGTLGMIEARRRFDPARGVAFRTFAWYRVRGAIYDGLRELSWLPSNAYKRLRAAERTDLYMETLAETAYGNPTRAVATKLVGEAVADLSVVYLTTEAGAAAREPKPEATTLPGEEVCDLGRVLDEVDKLSEQERTLLRRLYVEDASLSEAGRELGLSRSWLCRLHATTIRKLRRRLGIPEDGLPRPAD